MQGDNLYEYAVVRYVPRIDREEFINVGLLMMCKRRKWIRVATRVDAARLAFFPGVHPAEAVERQLLTFERVALGKKDGGPMAALPAEERFRWLTAVKSSCLQTSRPHPGLSDDLDGTFERLFREMVE